MYAIRSYYGAMNGIEAMEYIDSKKPDLLLLDIRMPGMDGYEVLAEMRKKKRNNFV